MHPESELIPISALQHWLYCPRQCALIHLEQAWAENRFTAEGRILHQRAHDGPDDSRPGLRIARGMSVRSLALSLTGHCCPDDLSLYFRITPVAPFTGERAKQPFSFSVFQPSPPPQRRAPEVDSSGPHPPNHPGWKSQVQ